MARVQLMIRDEDKKRHTHQARKEGLTLSAWLRAAAEVRLAPAKGIPFIVNHDAFRYFEERYDLTATGSVLGSAHQPLSVRRVKKLREKVHEYDIKCVFSEPQFDPDKPSVVVEGSSARVATIDPLGAKIEDGPELNFVLIDQLADSFVGCLAVDG